MTATRDASIAARVPHDLREDLEARVEELRRRGATYDGGRPVDLSYVVRHALRAYIDGYPALEERLDALGSLDHAPRSHSRGPATERAAAAAAWPRANTQRRRALELVARASAATQPATVGPRIRGLPLGVTGDELDQELGGYNGRRRLSELKAGGWVEVLAVDGLPVHRRTRAGALAGVYVLTPAAKRELNREARLV